MARSQPTPRVQLLPPRLERSLVWRIKLRLQFTGWLQYLPPLVAGSACALLAALGWLSGLWPAVFVGVPGTLAGLLLALGLFDVVTVKLGVRPAEPIPAPRDGLDVFELMRVRRSCRSFQARRLTEAHREAVLEVARRCTRAEHLLGDRPIRLAYIAAPLTVWPVVGAGEFLVAIAPEPYDRAAVIDVGRSLQEVVLAATRMGLGTCWIGPGADQRSIAARLGSGFDPAVDHIICVCAIGYRSRFVPAFVRLLSAKMGGRLPLDRLFFADPGFCTPLDPTAPPLAAFGPCYEACRWSPSSYNSQTTRCAAVTADGGSRVVRFDFAAATDSRYYAAVALGIWLANWEIGCAALGLEGHFAALSPGERSVDPGAGSPHSDISWIVDG